MAEAMEEVTTSVTPTVTYLKNKQGEPKELEVETRVFMEECIALKNKVQPNTPVVVDVDAKILELLVSFLGFRAGIRGEFPDYYKATTSQDDTPPALRPKKKTIQDREFEWVDNMFNKKYTPELGHLMKAAVDLNIKSLKEVLAEWIVEHMIDEYPEKIGEFFGIKCDHSEEFLKKHKEDFDWAYSNVKNSSKQKQKEQEKLKMAARNNTIRETDHTMQDQAGTSAS